MILDKVPTVGECRLRWCVLAPERGGDFLEKPRAGHGGAADHEAGNCGAVPALNRRGGGVDVAVADHRNPHRLGHRGDDVPVGLPGVSLGAGAAVHGEAADAGIFEASGIVRRIDRLFVPAGADFGRDGQRRDGADDGGGDGGEEGAVAEEGGSAVFANHLVDRAAEVEVDEVGLFPINDRSGAPRELFGFTAEELDSERMLFGGGVDELFGALVAVQDTLGRDKFGG